MKTKLDEWYLQSSYNVEEQPVKKSELVWHKRILTLIAIVTKQAKVLEFYSKDGGTKKVFQGGSGFAQPLAADAGKQARSVIEKCKGLLNG